MAKCITVTVEADVWLDDIDTDDLVAELASRGDIAIAHAKEEGVATTPPLRSETHHPLHDTFYAFKSGLTDRATELARAYVCDELGVVL